MGHKQIDKRERERVGERGTETEEEVGERFTRCHHTEKQERLFTRRVMSSCET